LGITFVVVTHELASIFEIADDSIFLDGKSKTIVACGKPDSLRSSSSIDVVRDFLTRGKV
jgi:phospholipid/cholesterol/gamma-HCH transport system ATP-binding protein